MTDKIVQEVTPDTMLVASYEHFASYVLYCGQASGGEFYDTPQFAWAFSGDLSPYMNSIVRTRLDPEADVDACIETVLVQARRRSVRVGWFLTPGTMPEDIGSKLEAHGFKFESYDPALSVDLQTLPDHVPAPNNLRIVEVLDRSTLEEWVDTWGDSYRADAAKRQSRLLFRSSLGLDASSSYRPYLAYLGDQPVATSELFLGAGVAQLYGWGRRQRRAAKASGPQSHWSHCWKPVIWVIASVH